MDHHIDRIGDLKITYLDIDEAAKRHLMASTGRKNQLSRQARICSKDFSNENNTTSKLPSPQATTPISSIQRSTLHASRTARRADSPPSRSRFRFSSPHSHAEGHRRAEISLDSSFARTSLLASPRHHSQLETEREDNAISLLSSPIRIRAERDNDKSTSTDAMKRISLEVS